MTSEHARVKEIFLAARDEEPGKRAEFVARVCEGDPGLRREVEELLGYGATQQGPLDGIVPQPRVPPHSRHGVTFTRVDGSGAATPASPLSPDLLQRAVKRLRIVGQSADAR